MNNIYYVYVHKKKTDGLIFYVGKGKGQRCSSLSGKNKHWHNIVNKHGYYIEFLKKGISEDEAFLIEIIAIRNFTLCGYKLTNRSTGGEGASGVVHTDETKEKFRMAKLGKKQKPEHAAKSAIARIGKKNNPESTERTIALKRKKIVNSDGICFISSHHAAMYLTCILEKKCHQGIISMCARGLRNNAYGATWSYDTSIVPEFRKTKTAEKKILCKENNMTFDSVQKAVKWVSDNLGSANNQCISESARSNGNRTAYGYHWEYL